LLESAPGVFNGLTSDLKNNSFQKDYFKAIWSAEKYALITIIGVLPLMPFQSKWPIV